MARPTDPPKKPDPKPGLPDLSQATRTIIVTSDPDDNWTPQVEHANWVSPYEAYALLWKAAAELGEQLDLNGYSDSEATE